MTGDACLEVKPSVNRMTRKCKNITLWVVNIFALEIFTISISVISGRFKGELPLSDFVGFDYLLRCTDSSKGRSP